MVVVNLIIMSVVLAMPLVGMLAWTKALRAMPAARQRPGLASVLWLLPALGYLGWAGSLLWDGFKDPTSRNLWPFEMMFILVYWLAYVAFVWVLLRIAHWLRGRFGSDGH